MNAAAIRLLAEKGLTASDIAEVAETLEQKKDATGAERQRRYRERKKAESDAVTRDVTRDDVTDRPLSRPPNEINSNPPTHTPETNTARVRADDFPCPDWCETEVWRDLKRNRRTKKLTNTPTAHKRFVSAIEEMADDEWPPGRLVEEIAAKGWAGPHDPRENRKPANDRQPSSTANAAAMARANLAGSHH